tara:strand:- start:4829 stop:5485 length:657 start_codon:yes stop_codon:yes gene_type:complete
MNKLPEEIIDKICKKLCIYNFSNISKLILINKSISKYIKNYLNIFNTTNETILMATKVKVWRIEIDQSDYIYDSFMLFDNIEDYHKWDKNTECFSKSCVNREYKEIIQSNLYTTSISPTLYVNKNEKTYNNINYNYVSKEFYYDLENNIKYDIDKLNFDTYFIYYFAEDINTCYAIHFLILPYFDSRMKTVKDYHSYNIVKKNTICNHNITKVDSIDF